MVYSKSFLYIPTYIESFLHKRNCKRFEITLTEIETLQFTNLYGFARQYRENICIVSVKKKAITDKKALSRFDILFLFSCSIAMEKFRISRRVLPLTYESLTGRPTISAHYGTRVRLYRKSSRDYENDPINSPSFEQRADSRSTSGSFGARTYLSPRPRFWF